MSDTNLHYSKTYWTYTFKNNADLMDEIVAIYQEEVQNVKDAPGIVPACVFQPITTAMTKHFSRNGGNALGLEGEGPLTRKLYSFLGPQNINDTD